MHNIVAFPGVCFFLAELDLMYGEHGCEAAEFPFGDGMSDVSDCHSDFIQTIEPDTGRRDTHEYLHHAEQSKSSQMSCGDPLLKSLFPELSRAGQLPPKSANTRRPLSLVIVICPTGNVQGIHSSGVRLDRVSLLVDVHDVLQGLELSKDQTCDLVRMVTEAPEAPQLWCASDPLLEAGTKCVFKVSWQLEGTHRQTRGRLAMHLERLRNVMVHLVLNVPVFHLIRPQVLARFKNLQDYAMRLGCATMSSDERWLSLLAQENHAPYCGEGSCSVDSVVGASKSCVAAERGTNAFMQIASEETSEMREGRPRPFLTPPLWLRQTIADARPKVLSDSLGVNTVLGEDSNTSQSDGVATPFKEGRKKRRAGEPKASRSVETAKPEVAGSFDTSRRLMEQILRTRQSISPLAAVHATYRETVVQLSKPEYLGSLLLMILDMVTAARDSHKAMMHKSMDKNIKRVQSRQVEARIGHAMSELIDFVTVGFNAMLGMQTLELQDERMHETVRTFIAQREILKIEIETARLQLGEVKAHIELRKRQFDEELYKHRALCEVEIVTSREEIAAVRARVGMVTEELRQTLQIERESIQASLASERQRCNDEMNVAKLRLRATQHDTERAELKKRIVELELAALTERLQLASVVSVQV